MKLILSSDRLAVCRLDKDSPLPSWAVRGRFFSITRTDEEISIVCPQDQAPAGVKKETGWRALQVEGPLDFSQTGILASLTAPLAREKVSVFAISTYDTDYLLVKEENLEKAIDVLIQEGHRIQKQKI